MTTTSKRTVLITGCSLGGVGHSLALEFAKQGLHVFATARSTKQVADLEEKGIEVFALDVTSAESIAALKEDISRRTGGKLDILFNNAGTMYEAPAIEANPIRVREMYNANVFGLFDMVTAFTPLLLAAVAGSQAPPAIVNTASIVSRLPNVFSSAYNASKAAVASYSDTLRLELAPLGIKVVTLFMGEVATRMMAPGTVDFAPDSVYSDIEAIVQKRGEGHATKSMKPEDFAAQVVKQVLSTPAIGKNEFLWKGTNAFLIWVLNAFGYRKVFDPVCLGLVGLDKADNKKAVFAKGQKKVAQK